MKKQSGNMEKAWRSDHAGIKQYWAVILMFLMTSRDVTSLLMQSDDFNVRTLKSHARTDVSDYYHGDSAAAGLFGHRRVRRQTGNGLMTTAEQQLILQKHNERRRKEVRAEGVSNMEVMVSL